MLADHHCRASFLVLVDVHPEVQRHTGLRCDGDLLYLSVVGFPQVVLLSATMPAEVLEVTKKFMRDPVRILVKKEELTLEGIKQFYINVEREVCVCLFFKVKWKPSLQKHPAGTAGARPRWSGSCGCVSTGTPGKENKGTGSKRRQ